MIIPFSIINAFSGFSFQHESPAVVARSLMQFFEHFGCDHTYFTFLSGIFSSRNAVFLQSRFEDKRNQPKFQNRREPTTDGSPTSSTSQPSRRSPLYRQRSERRGNDKSLTSDRTQPVSGVEKSRHTGHRAVGHCIQPTAPRPATPSAESPYLATGDNASNRRKCCRPGIGLTANAMGKDPMVDPEAGVSGVGTASNSLPANAH